MYAAGSRLLWTLLQVGDDPLLQPPARMGHTRELWRAIEVIRLLRYPPLLNSLVELISPRNFNAFAANCAPASLKAWA